MLPRTCTILIIVFFIIGIWPYRLTAERISPLGEEDGLKNEPTIEIETPNEFCKYDMSQRGKSGYETGYEPGLKKGTSLIALYVPCLSLEAADKGKAEWLPEWIAYEKNIVTFPSDDTRSLGTRGAVKQLCNDARLQKYGHPSYQNTNLVQLVVEAYEKLNKENPVIFFGVIHEEERVCYLSSLRLLYSPSGQQHKFLVVTAFMQTGDRWIYQTLRREVPSQPNDLQSKVANCLEQTKNVAQAFVKKNF
ncbi:MAG: hypothetical protein ACKOW3_03630 [Hyphomicrobium sp.]